jgi:hypothetical protein
VHLANGLWLGTDAIDPTRCGAGVFDLTGGLRVGPDETGVQQLSTGFVGGGRMEHVIGGCWSEAGSPESATRGMNSYYLSGCGSVLRFGGIASQQSVVGHYRDQLICSSDRGWSAACVADPSAWDANTYGLSDGASALQFNAIADQGLAIDACFGQLRHLPDGSWSAVGVFSPGNSAVGVYRLPEVGSALAFQDVAGLHLTAQDYHDQLARSQDGGWSAVGIVDPGRWMANSLYLPEIARALPVSEIMSQQPALYAQHDQVACFTRGQINATIRDVGRAVDGLYHFGAASDASLGGGLRDQRYAYGGDGLVVTTVSGMGQPIAGETLLLHANPCAPGQFDPSVAWTPERTTWPAEPEQSPPPRKLSAARVLRAVVAGDRKLPPTLPAADGLEILAAELLAALDDDAVTRPRLPAWDHSRLARTMCNCMTEVNTLADTAGLPAIFKPTNRLVKAVTVLPSLAAYNRSKFVEFLNWMYQAFYEGSGYAKRVREHLTDEECDALWRLKHLRTWAHHDVEHGDPQEAVRKKRLIAESFEMLIGKLRPETREDFLRSQSELSRRIMSMMRLLQTRLQTRTIH